MWTNIDLLAIIEHVETNFGDINMSTYRPFLGLTIPVMVYNEAIIKYDINLISDLHRIDQNLFEKRGQEATGIQYYVTKRQGMQMYS